MNGVELTLEDYACLHSWAISYYNEYSEGMSDAEKAYYERLIHKLGGKL